MSNLRSDMSGLGQICSAGVDMSGHQKLRAVEM
jgi:hypothetical protein